MTDRLSGIRASLALTGRPARALLTAIAVSVAAMTASEVVGTTHANSGTLSLRYKGFGYPAFYSHAYEDADSLSSLAATGANAVEVTLDYGIDVVSSQVVTDPSYTDSLTALGSVIDEAKGLGLTVMVRPLIDFLDPAVIGPYSVGDWRQTYQPTDVAAFFASYQQMILAQAQVAQQHGAQMVSIGAELDQLAGAPYQSYWSGIITAVRGIFTGQLTYSASWSTATQVSFWALLDYQGVDCYVPLSSASNPTVQDLVNGWTRAATPSFNPNAYAVIGNQSPIQYFQGLAAQSGKPLLFTEIGYANDSGAAADPSAEGDSVDPALQANLYQAFFQAWALAGPTSLVGIFFWEWDPNGGTSNVGPNIDSFSPQNSPAQTAVTNGFNAVTSSTDATTTNLLAAPNPSTFGQSVTFTASVSSSGGTPTGTVTFADGAATLGTGTLAAGSAALATTSLAPGPHAITAAYGGDGTFTASASAPVTQQVDTVGLAVSPESAITASGISGGPFTPASFQYQISTSSGSVRFAISGVPSWLTASTTSGTATTSPTTVTFTVNASAIGLPPSTDAATIAFTNSTNGLGNQTRSATLTVGTSGSPPTRVARTWVSGTGSDGNPCSRTQPCLTFAGAFAKTTAGGEIDVLDPGDFGTLTITNAITIDGRGVVASILYAGSTGMTISAGAGDNVILRNLSLNGAGSGLVGIAFNSGTTLRLRNVTIMNSAPGAPGLVFSPTAASQLIAQSASFINNGGGGILVAPANGGSAEVSLVRARMNGNGAYGLRADGTASGAGPINVEVSSSQAANNATDGIDAISGAAGVIVVIRRSALVHNGVSGLQASGANSYVLADDSMIEGNNVAAASAAGGGTYTFQTNVTNGNAISNGGFTAALPLR